MEDIKVRKESSKASIPQKMTFDLHALESSCIGIKTYSTPNYGFSTNGNCNRNPKTAPSKDDLEMHFTEI